MTAMSLDLEALETSFDMVAPRGADVVRLTYTRLFAAAPAVRQLFAGTDMERHQTVVLRTLVLVHGMLSFGFNTVILALTLNTVSALF